MQRVPPIDRELHDRDVDEANERRDRRDPPGLALILDGVEDCEDAEIDQEEHQHRGQARIPDPAGASQLLAPERTRDEAQECEGAADRSRGLERHLGEWMAPDEAPIAEADISA